MCIHTLQSCGVFLPGMKLDYQKRTACLMSIYTSEVFIVTEVWVYKLVQLHRNKCVVGFCISVLLFKKKKKIGLLCSY